MVLGESAFRNDKEHQQPTEPYPNAITGNVKRNAARSEKFWTSCRQQCKKLRQLRNNPMQALM